MFNYRNLIYLHFKNKITIKNLNKQLLLAILLIITLLSCNKDEANGFNRIKQIDYTNFRYAPDSPDLVEEKFISYYSYDSNGYTSDLTSISEEGTYINKYTYNDNSQLIYKTSSRYGYEYTFEYYANGDLKKMIDDYAIRTYVYNSEGEISGFTKEMNSSGNVYSFNYIYGDGVIRKESIGSKNYTDYFFSGRREFKANLILPNAYMKKSVFHYNNIESQIRYSFEENGDFRYATKYIYTNNYDDMGRPIEEQTERVTLSEDGSVIDFYVSYISHITYE
ncbi:MAG: hypothetical protein HRT66_05455 [Flavobacteriaceae bacterium]|nr:hypothetical protein [Flavobacteriaceae bacterium]